MDDGSWNDVVRMPCLPPQPLLQRRFFREPIPEIEMAAGYLDAAVSAHLRGNRKDATELLRLANDDTVRAWLDSIWGAQSPYTCLRFVADAPAVKPKAQRAEPRQANAEMKRLLHLRDGFYCRYCKIPVVRARVRDALNKAYPLAAPWGPKIKDCHAGLQCMWAQYDHIFPHARGGTTTLDNMCISCAACNYGRMDYTLEQVGIMHPDTHDPRRGPWDGLERFIQSALLDSRNPVGPG